MVNFGLNSASILGIFLAVAGAGLYFLRSVRPEVSRDYDIFFSAVGLLCGLILLFQGWRLDPILQFGQLLLTGSTVFFAVETIRLRGITTEQARRSTPYADDRRVSKTRVYTEAELDQIEPYETEEPARNNRRLRGYDDEDRPARPDPYGESESRPRRPPSSRNRRPTANSRGERERPSRRRPPGVSRPSRSGYDEEYDTWDNADNDMWDEPTPPSRRRPKTDRPERDDAVASRRAPSRPSRRPQRPTPREAQQYEDEPPAAYVDYQPIDDSETPPSSRPDETPRSPRPPVDERSRRGDRPVGNPEFYDEAPEANDRLDY